MLLEAGWRGVYGEEALDSGSASTADEDEGADRHARRRCLGNRRGRGRGRRRCRGAQLGQAAGRRIDEAEPRRAGRNGADGLRCDGLERANRGRGLGQRIEDGMCRG